MSRQYTSGLEFAHLWASGLAVGGGTPTIDTTRPCTGTYSLLINASGEYVRPLLPGAAITGMFTMVSGRDYFCRTKFNLDALPTVSALIQEWVVNGVWSEIHVTSTGAIDLRNQVGGTIAISGAGVVASDIWYRLEFRIRPSSVAGQTQLEANLYLGDSTTVLWTSGSFTNVTTTTTLANSYCGIGQDTSDVLGTSIWFDDIAVNDNQGASQNTWCGPGAIRKAKPVFDANLGTAPSNWTKPAGASESRETSVDNAPPIFRADSTNIVDGESLLRNATNALSDLTLDMQSYNVIGVPAGDSIALVELQAITGSSTTVAKAYSSEIVSNPVLALTADGNFPVAFASAVATTWIRKHAARVYNPSVVRANQPRVRVRRGTGTGVTLLNAVGLLVESYPSVDVTPPTVNLTSSLTQKISDEATKDSYSYSFAIDEACQAWKIKVVSNEVDIHTAGTQVEAGGAVGSGATVSGQITYAELVAAGVGPEGEKRLKFFGQDTAGNWSI